MGSGGTIDWSQAPFATPGQFYGVNKPEWQKAVGADENWIQKEMGSGERITGNIPGMFRGDILDLNRYGQFGDFNTQNNTQFAPHTNKPGTWNPMSQSDIAALSNYQNWAYGQENQPGGGGVQAWGQYQGYGPNTAANDWGGAYSAYMANQAMQAGVAPGTGFGFGTTAGSSPFGTVPSGGMPGAPTGATGYNYGKTGVNYYNQYGIPLGTFPAPGGTPTGPATAPTPPAPAPTPQPPGSNVPNTQPPGQPYNPWEQQHQQGAFPSNNVSFGAPAPNPWDQYRMKPRNF